MRAVTWFFDICMEIDWSAWVSLYHRLRLWVEMIGSEVILSPTFRKHLLTTIDTEMDRESHEVSLPDSFLENI